MAAEHQIYSPKWLKTRFSGAKIDQKTNMAVEACQIFNSLLERDSPLWCALLRSPFISLFLPDASLASYILKH